jgi:3-hydroxyacyl-[acyl-carrier-protein] dehydratase
MINAVLEMDIASEIFEGHFPGQPILPGACMVQLVKEVLEENLSSILKLEKADNLKFLSLIDPHKNNLLLLEINYTIDERQIKATASLIAEDVVCFKFQGVFVR